MYAPYIRISHQLAAMAYKTISGTNHGWDSSNNLKKKKIIEPTVTKREYTSELILVIKAKA